MADTKRLFVLDGTAQLYRAHFAMINNPLTTSTGQVTSGIFGFINSLIRLLRDESPDYFAVVFDDREKTSRHHIYPEYKATREKMPDELISQIEPLDRILEALKVPVLCVPGYEADDLMGTLATQAEAKEWDTFLVTGDKDMMQLVSEHTFVYTPGRGRNPAVVYDAGKVEERWGVPPGKMVDLLGLMGDSSDNVPGVQGVGEKTAQKLIAEYGSLEEALDHADEVANKRAREGLQTGRELALLSKKLVTLNCHVPLDVELDHLTLDNLDPGAATEELRLLEIKAVVSDLLRLGEEAVVASFFENIRALFSVKRPVLALSVITVVLIIAVSITQFLPFHKQSDTQDVVNVYLAEQIEYIAYLDENGEFDTNYGTGIEEYFLSEGNF